MKELIKQITEHILDEDYFKDCKTLEDVNKVLEEDNNDGLYEHYNDVINSYYKHYEYLYFDQDEEYEYEDVVGCIDSNLNCVDLEFESKTLYLVF